MRASAPVPTALTRRRTLAEDYAKKGFPYVFDMAHSKCPNDGHELQVENRTVMPSLRLSRGRGAGHRDLPDDAKASGAGSYPEAAFMNDPNLKARGKQWFTTTAAPAAMRFRAWKRKAASAPSSPSKAQAD